MHRQSGHLTFVSSFVQKVCHARNTRNRANSFRQTRW